MGTKNIAVIILAAGKGERMKSGIPKVLHPVCGRPMLGYVLDVVKDLKPGKTIAVLGYKHEEVRKALIPGIEVVLQKEQKGTADAVKQALPLLKNFKGTVLVLYGDTPLLTRETIQRLLKRHSENDASATLLTATADKPAGYGRILRDKYSGIRGIIEEKDADEFQKDIKEINTGIMCFDKDTLYGLIKDIKPNNRKHEYYLTDAIDILYKKERVLESVNLPDIDEAMGINSRLELAKANALMQARINEEFMKQGVSIVDPGSCFINYGTAIGRDTVIYPFTVIERNVKIGRHCSIGPFVHLREGSRIEDDVLLGNFLEIVRSRIGAHTFVKHFSYVGDSQLGRRVNIGAGTVTANFDGKDKNLTVIKDDAFIGSHSVLIAPVKVGTRAVTAAGSVVLKNTFVRDGQVVAGVPAKPLLKKKGILHG
jgi:bifunctional UDP-N-acetylglucosamine pyrophosphorylase/glucosamine-1-phosphate N-acetyltransferase